MPVGTNLASWIGGGTRDRELRETRNDWDETEALWRASPLGRDGIGGTTLAIVKSVMRGAERVPAVPVLVAVHEATEALLRAEDITPLEADWAVINSDVAIAYNVRQMLRRRRRWASDYDALYHIVRRQLGWAYENLFVGLPEGCFGDWENGGASFEVPLIELLDDPVMTISQLLIFAYDDDTLRHDVFLKYRRAVERNLLVASGFPPDADPAQHNDRLIAPSAQKNKTPRELADLYLAGTPFAALLELPVPFAIPEESRFEHCHIVGGTGHGKTQLMQRMIHADLVAAQTEQRSMVVIDSQGDLINKLVRLDLFAPDGALADRLVVIDPADVEFPASLNLFATNLDRFSAYSPADRERVLNGVVELYETFFGALLGAELTQKQGVIFRYLARLMMAIPGATIHDLMRLMENGHPYRPHMAALTGSARYFFETEFFHPSFAATKKQILKRLWGVLSTPAFERMFAQKENKLDLFDALTDGKIILINTAKDLLKQDGSQLFGRFFIAMLAQASLERSTLRPNERTPTFVYVDEAQEYFDDNVETILNQARKYRVGLTIAHQSLDQLSPRLRAIIHANTSLKCVGGASARDSRALADELHTRPEFIESMRRRGDRTEFAVWLKNMTPHAIRLSAPLGYLERQPTLTEEEYDLLLDENRRRYCGTFDDVLTLGLAGSEVADNPAPPEKMPRRDTVQSRSPPEPSMPTPTVPATEASRPSPGRTLGSGKGGPKHRYLQALAKELGEQQGFKATIEAPLASGGQVDVLLERGDLRIAVEVSVTTPVEWERENLRKCLAGSFSRVVLVLAKSRATQGRYERALLEGLSETDRSRLAILAPEDLPDFIAAHAAPPAPSESLVKGYKVRVSRTAVSPEEVKARRDTLARLVSKSLSQKD